MRFGKRLRALWQRRRLESDLAEEMRIHIEMAESKLREKGTTEEQARIQARQQFGSRALAMEESRAAWSFSWIEDLVQDLCYAARGWVRSPGFAVTVIATIGLALGLNTALFTAFDYYVLRPLAVRDPSSLFQVMWKTQSGGGHLFTWKEYERLNEQKHLFAETFAVVSALRQLDEHPATVQLVTPNFFEMLAANIRMGRPFTHDDAPAPGVGAYIVLSDACWKSKFGSDPQILGRKVFIRGQPFKVIGVADPEFKGVAFTAPDFWVPLTMYAALHNDTDVFAPATPGSLIAVVRLLPGISLDAVKPALLAWSREQTKDYPHDQKAIGVYIESRASSVPMNQGVVLSLVPIFIAFGLVLLTACANVSNMMLSRAVMRQREIGIRLSLGAARLRLIRQLLTEALLLSFVAALAGWAISELTIRTLQELVYRTLPSGFVKLLQFPEMHADYRVFSFLALAVVITTLLFGLLPAVQATRSGFTYALNGGFGNNFHPSRLKNVLIVAQVFV